MFTQILPRFIGLLMVLTGLWFLTEPSPNELISTESVIIDQTDSFNVEPNLEDILLPLKLNDYKHKRVSLRIQTVTNLDYNTIFDFKLPNRPKWISNPGNRDKEIKLFKSKVIRHLDSMNSQRRSLPNSHIYRTLITELNRLAEIHEKKKIQIVYSDLFEHSTLFDSYDPNQLNSLRLNPDKVKATFLKSLQCGNYSGIRVFIVYKPSTKTDNERFILMSSLFRSILGDSGATVYIGANITEHNS